MINPNTLQIGNLIKHHDNPEPFKLNAYGILNVSLHPENYSPLPITEERLRDAGFVENARTKVWRFDDKVLAEFYENEWWVGVESDSPERNEYDMHTLLIGPAWHDLQNLVRLISGKDI